jgi:hypothetical protein
MSLNMGERAAMTESQEDTLMKAHLERIVKFISFKYLQ